MFDFLKEAGKMGVKPCSTPMSPNLHLCVGDLCPNQFSCLDLHSIYGVPIFSDFPLHWHKIEVL